MRGMASDIPNAGGDSYAQLYTHGQAVKVGDYHYVSVGPQAACATTGSSSLQNQVISLVNKDEKIFSTMVQTAKSE